MEFDKSRVFTTVNADEVKVGSKGYFADNLAELEAVVGEEVEHRFNEILYINPPSNSYRFNVKNTACNYLLFYLVEEPSTEHKEVTASEWDNRPRLMKVWDDDYSEAKERKVIYIASKEDNLSYPVVVLNPAGDIYVGCFKHCAEIDATKEVEKEKSYRPYKNSDEFIADYKKRFCPDCKGIPAIWVKNVADTLKRIFPTLPIDFYALLNNYTYPDGSPCGMEE